MFVSLKTGGLAIAIGAGAFLLGVPSGQAQEAATAPEAPDEARAPDATGTPEAAPVETTSERGVAPLAPADPMPRASPGAPAGAVQHGEREHAPLPLPPPTPRPANAAITLSAVTALSAIVALAFTIWTLGSLDEASRAREAFAQTGSIDALAAAQRAESRADLTAALAGGLWGASAITGTSALGFWIDLAIRPTAEVGEPAARAVLGIAGRF